MDLITNINTYSIFNWLCNDLTEMADQLKGKEIFIIHSLLAALQKYLVFNIIFTVYCTRLCWSMRAKGFGFCTVKKIRDWFCALTWCLNVCYPPEKKIILRFIKIPFKANFPPSKYCILITPLAFIVLKAFSYLFACFHNETWAEGKE